MQDLGHSFHSPEYELTISHGDPIHGPGFLKKLLFTRNTILEFRQTPIFRISGFQHLATHPGLPGLPLDAHRGVSMDCPSFRMNYGTRAELCPKPFENHMNRATLWIPNISALLLEQEDVPLPGEELILLLGQEYLLPEEVGLKLDVRRPPGSTLWDQ